ncbi:MAG: tyrosine-type recombinase/integrase, partial [Blastocatellia bacterium]
MIRIVPGEIERRGASLTDQWADYLGREVRAGQMAEATAATYRRGLRKFVEWGAANLERATDHAVKEWLADLRAAKTSQNAISVWFAGVRSFFAWAVSEKLLPADPTQGVKRGKRTGTAKMHKREMLTDDEMIRVLTGDLSARDRALVHLLAYTGARGVEMHRADIGDLKTDGGELVLHVQGKGRDEKDERVVIAHLDAKDAIYAYLAERKASQGALFTSESNRSEG